MEIASILIPFHGSVLPVLKIQINGFLQYALFCVWLLSLKITCFRFIYVMWALVAGCFLLLDARICDSLFIDSPVDRCLGCLKDWAVMNKDMVHILVQVLWTYALISVGYVRLISTGRKKAHFLGILIVI